MVGPRNAGRRFWIQTAVAAFGAVIVALGCASPQAPSSADGGQGVQTLGDVSVTRDGEGSIVFLDGLEDPIYSVAERADENLVVVDLVGVSQGEATSLMGAMGGDVRQVASYDGVVDLVTLSTFEGEDGVATTRVEIQLAEKGQAVVNQGASGLEVTILPGMAEVGLVDDVPAEAADASLQDAAMALAGEDLVGEDMVGEDMVETSEALVVEATDEAPAEAGSLFEDVEERVDAMEAPVAEVPTAEPAKVLERVSAQATAGGVLVGLMADGALDNVEVFTLENPARLVVDIPGVQAAASARNVKVESAIVSGVRVGAHDGKVRVVVDGGSAAGGFASRQVMPGATGMWIGVGEGDALAAAMSDALALMEAAFLARGAAKASEPRIAATVADEASGAPSAVASEGVETDRVEAAKPTAAAAGSVEVYGLSFERLSTMDRTAILAEGPITFSTYAPDAATLVVRIPNAHISEAASDRVFPEPGGPVSMIHAFQQPEVTVPEVRVVFTRAPNQKPVLSTHGSTLFVDFEEMGVAAAAPPAFPGESPAAMASSGAASTAAPESGAPAAADAAASALPTQAELASMPQTVQPAALEQAEALFAQPEPAVPVAAAPPAAVEVPAAIEVLEEGGLIDGKEYRGRRVSLDFKDVAIADVLRLIAEVSDLNIIAGDEVSGNVTIRLVDVPWDQALDVILMTKGLGFVRVGNVLRIAPSDVLKAEEEVRLQERRNKEKLEDLEVKLLPVNYAAVKDIEQLVRRLLSARGTVNLDKRTNTLIIKDISSVIDEATALIAAIDTQTPQVMIEAKIVEANLDFSRELGSVWGIQTNQFVDPFDPDTLRTDLGSEDLTFIDTNGLAFANPIKAVPTGLATFGALILDQDFRVDAQIQAAEATGDGKVISSPRIVTLDNKEATIKQGVSIPFQTFEGGDAKLEFIDAVLSLIVTPHITADQSIIMQVEVTRNAPDSTVPTPTGSPAISKNVAETNTLVKDGQTLVLGGIYTISKSQRQSRVPYLHRIPVIGNLFKNNQITDSRKELLVFVTPRIVRIPEMAAN
ncbi:MAG: type IV pilus secretin PilQ [Myxococcota bacterium]